MARIRDYAKEERRRNEIARAQGFSSRAEKRRLRAALSYSSDPAKRAYDAFRKVAYERGVLSSATDNANALRLFFDVARDKVHAIGRGSQARETTYQGERVSTWELLEKKGIVSGGGGGDAIETGFSSLSPERQASVIERDYIDTYGHEPDSQYDLDRFVDDEGYYDFDWEAFWENDSVSPG